VDTTEASTPDRAHNPRFVHSLTGVRVLGTLPFLPVPSPEGLAAALRRSVDVDAILTALR